MARTTLLAVLLLSTPTLAQPCDPPKVTEQPKSQHVQIGDFVDFTIAAEGTGVILFFWRHNGELLEWPPINSYNILSATPEDAGIYDVWLLSSCGEAFSEPATLVVGNACYPDCEADGDLDIDDFICFQTLYAFSDPYADCEADGDHDIDDFVCYQTMFAFGCP